MVRFMPWARQQKVIDELQRCSHQGCSSLHTSWLVSETVSYNLERGSDVYVALLDIKKAFDSVWIDDLIFTLREQSCQTNVILNYKLLASIVSEFVV